MPKSKSDKTSPITLLNTAILSFVQFETKSIFYSCKLQQEIAININKPKDLCSKKGKLSKS